MIKDGYEKIFYYIIFFAGNHFLNRQITINTIESYQGLMNEPYFAYGFGIGAE